VQEWDGTTWVPLSTPPFEASVNAGTVTDTIRPDTVFVPFHWGGGTSANALTDPTLDPHSKMPAFKVCAVAVERTGGPDDDAAAAPPAVNPVRRDG